MMPKREPISFAPVLNRYGAIGRLECFRKLDGDFVHARSRLGMQAFDRDVEGEHFDHQRLEEFAILVGAQERVSEHAGRDRVRPDVTFVGPGLRRLGEIEPLEFDSAHRRNAKLLGALEYPLEGLPRAHRMRHFLAVLLRHEIAEEERHAVVPRHVAMRAEVDPGECIRETLVPAGHRGVVVTLVAHVPAEDDVAKAEATLRGGEELVLVQVLAAQHAVDVGHRHLDALAGLVANGVEDLLGGDRLRHVSAPLLLALRLRDGRRSAIVTRRAASAGGSDGTIGVMP